MKLDINTDIYNFVNSILKSNKNVRIFLKTLNVFVIKFP